MRRSKQALPPEVCEEILANGTSGVLAVCGADGRPYAVPLSYVADGGSIVFHGAAAGHKMDALAENPHASFCVVEQDVPVPDEFTTRYRSVIAFGDVRVVEDVQERIDLLVRLGERYWPGHAQEAKEYAARAAGKTAVFVLNIDELTGKEQSKLAKERRG